MFFLQMDLIDEPVNVGQISWCMDEVMRNTASSRDNSCLPTLDNISTSAVPSMSAGELQRLLLTKCGCVIDNVKSQTPQQQLTLEHVINAFCHPDVIAKVSQILLSTKI